VNVEGVATVDPSTAGTRSTRPSENGGAAGGIAARCGRIAEDRRFQGFIIAVIVLNAVTVGVETSSALAARFGPWFRLVNLAALTVFTAEMVIRVAAYWPRPLQFFRWGWNVFDFVVVGVAFVPSSLGLSTLARLARVVRVTRLISALPELRLVFETMVRSIPSMGHILLLLALFLYVYGIIGVNLYSGSDPERWGSLGAAILTLFQVLTLEGWNEIQAALIGLHPWSWVFFSSFIVVAVWVVTNLFVAVIINNLESVKRAEAEQFDRDVPGTPLARIAEIREMLARLERDVRVAEEEIRDPRRNPST
jgi:voltage-gated sodium channel